jgi:hypothetical protein
VEVGHFQAKFYRPFLSPQISQLLAAGGSLERRLVAKSWETSKIIGLQLQLSLFRVRGREELVEKAGKSNTGDSTISHDSVVLPVA